MAELFLHSVFAREWAQLGAMKSRTEQVVDCVLKLLSAAENADRFADHTMFLAAQDFLRALSLVR